MKSGFRNGWDFYNKSFHVFYYYWLFYYNIGHPSWKHVQLVREVSWARQCVNIYTKFLISIRIICMTYCWHNKKHHFYVSKCVYIYVCSMVYWWNICPSLPSPRLHLGDQLGMLRLPTVPWRMSSVFYCFQLYLPWNNSLLGNINRYI